MNKFQKTIRIAVTPLSPIHIGCGIDFDPTNYVIRGKALYHFDPEKADLDNLRKKELERLSRDSDLLSIQNFFRNNADFFVGAARCVLPVTDNVEQEYSNKIGKVVQRDQKNGKDVINALAIERTTHHPHSDIPYLPGSSIKGAIRTAVLDRLMDEQSPILMDKQSPIPTEKKSVELEHKLLGTKNKLYLSSFRLIKISDMQPIGEPTRLVIKTTQYKKTQPSKNPSSERKEVIAPAQYRRFTGNMQIAFNEKNFSSNVPCIRNMETIAHDCNRYYLPQLSNELKMLKTQSHLPVSKSWLDDFENLFRKSGDIDQRFLAGKAFLIRLGKLAGAESKTFRGKGIAEIKIMQGKGIKPRYDSNTTTIQLGEINSVGKNSIQQPFGWALIEFLSETEDEEIGSLKRWCEKESVLYPDTHKEKQEIKLKQEEIRTKRLKEKEQQQIREEQAQKENKQKQEREAKRAAMSECDRTIDDIRILLDKVKKNDAGSQEVALCREKLEQAATKWTDSADKTKLADQIAPILKEKNLNSKKLKAVIQQLRNNS